MNGYDLTNKETEWVDMIARKSIEDLNKRDIKINSDNIYTTAIFAVTLFTRKLENIRMINQRSKK